MPQNLQEKILIAASDLFYSQGIRATGVDAIAKAANTTKMSLYRYFPSKDDLIVAVLRQHTENFRTWFITQVEAKADQPKAQLLAMFDVTSELMTSPEFRGCALINATAEFPQETGPVHQVSAEFYDSFRHYIADLATESQLKNPENLAFQLSLLIEGALVSEQMKRQSGAAKQAKQAAIMLIKMSES